MKTIGECGKHKGQSMINCPLCASENFTNNIKVDSSTKDEIHNLIKNLSDEQQTDVLYFLSLIVAKRKKISPQKLINLINNWETIEKLMYILKD